ncbi:VOC family protein [Kribbella sp. NPDC056861]|uniref:VOC family protein n=1 Tax=Kribbella sp. NPDC056861 TaxID=3154857 RepID=UPI003436EFD4
MATVSHVLVKVDDLRQAVNDYRALGFEVRYATDERRALHAHIWFPSGPIIELLASPRGARLFRLPIELRMGRGAGRRMVGWATQPEGFCSLAVEVSDEALPAVVSALGRAGVRCGRLVRWRRTRPDGEVTTFRFCYPREPDLPFLVTPYRPAQHPPEVIHPNGATAVLKVVLGVRQSDLDAVRQIVGAAPGVEFRAASRTGVLAVELAGLKGRLDRSRLHGAQFVANGIDDGDRGDSQTDKSSNCPARRPVPGCPA